MINRRAVGMLIAPLPHPMVRERIGELDLHAPRLIAVLGKGDISGGSSTINIHECGTWWGSVDGTS